MNHKRIPRIRWWIPLLGALVCCGLGAVSGIATNGGMQGWYQGLQKPPGNPPSWVFGPVWTLLYLLMGIAAGRLFSIGAWVAFGYFFVNFLLNLAWSPAFFVAHWLVASVAIILAMWVFLALTIRAAWNTDRISAYLLLPYLAWITYAAYLNIALAALNS